ncbi:MAG: hypothetical protein OMM_12567, partial [Candidatus Magnetoglobus multicellularis str. Araruama]
MGWLGPTPNTFLFFVRLLTQRQYKYKYINTNVPINMIKNKPSGSSSRWGKQRSFSLSERCFPLSIWIHPKPSTLK